VLWWWWCDERLNVLLEEHRRSVVDRDGRWAALCSRTMRLFIATDWGWGRRAYTPPACSFTLVIVCALVVSQRIDPWNLQHFVFFGAFARLQWNQEYELSCYIVWQCM
jgi:hypothetical protein